MRPIAIIQARMGSTRLPGKVLRPLVGKPMLWHIVDRVRQAPNIEEVVVATSDMPDDEPIRKFCQENDISVFAGDESDVLDRFYHAAQTHHGDPVFRITADCPLVDPQVMGRVLDEYESGEFDLVSVAAGAGASSLARGRYPDGLDAECIRLAALERAWHEAEVPSDREHVTPYLWRVPGRFRVKLVSPDADIDYSPHRWTVDTEADFDMIRRIYEALVCEGRRPMLNDVVKYLDEHPEIVELNRELIGREGYDRVRQGEGDAP